MGRKRVILSCRKGQNGLFAPVEPDEKSYDYAQNFIADTGNFVGGVLPRPPAPRWWTADVRKNFWI